jgi:hypothetical protein
LHLGAVGGTVSAGSETKMEIPVDIARQRE